MKTLLTQFIFIWQLFLDPEKKVVVPLVQPQGGFIGLDLIGESLAILLLNVLAQSLDIQTKAKQQQQQEATKVRKTKRKLDFKVFGSEKLIQKL